MNKILLLLIISISFVIAGCGGAESRKEKYMQSALEHYDLDDCAKAKLDFKNVLQIDPKDTDSRVGLARCLVTEQEWRQVYSLLNAVVADDPNHVEAKHELAKFNLIIGQRDEAYELIEEALGINPNHAGSIALRGVFHSANNTLVAARNDANQAIGIDDENIVALSLVSALNFKDENYDAAINLLQSASSKFKETNKRKWKEVQILLISAYARAGQNEKISAIFEGLVEAYPENIQYKNRLANIYAQNGNFAKGEAVLLSETEGDDSEEYKKLLSHVSFISQHKDAEQALKLLQKYASEDDADPKVKLALAQHYFKTKEYDQAKPILEELAEDKVNILEANDAKNYLAYSSLQDRDVEGALNLVDEVLAESPTNNRALMIRGTIALSKRDAPQAIADFSTLLRDQPNNLRVVRQLAAAYILNGQEDLAKDLVQRAVEIDSSSKDLNLLYARLQGKDQEFDSAISTVNQLIETDNQDLASIKTLFDLQVASKDYEGAKETADKLKSISEDNPLGYYLSGVLSQNDNDISSAERDYLTALEKNPRANEPLSALVRLYVSQEQIEKAFAFLDNMITEDPEYLVPYNLKGELALSQKDYPLATKSFEQAISQNATWWLPYRGLSLVHAVQNDIDGSFASLQRGIDNGANAERLGIDLALAQYKLDRRDDAIKTYETVIEKMPNSALAKNNLAMILVDDQADEQSISQAIGYIDDIDNINEGALLDTAGWVHYKAGNLNRAIEYLTKAIELSPEVPELHYHIGMAYAGQGILDKAKEHLQIATANQEANYEGREEAEQKLKELL